MKAHQVCSRSFIALVLSMGFEFASTAPVQASVVVTGTRVIYAGQDRDKTVLLANQDTFPNIVQAWIDIDDPASTPDTANGPFVINPTVSRLAPGSGQSLRIIYTGTGLPEDRESLFHLNILQIPPRNLTNSGSNQMLLMLRNRLKLFYRPAAIPGSSDQLPEKLRFSLVRADGDWRVRVDNPTGFHASFGAATISVGERILLLRANMVPPYSQAEWGPEKAVALGAGAPILRAQLINDYGARIEISHEMLR